MKITFVSVAALSLTASQAAKLHKQITPTPDQHLVQSERSPQSYSNILQSVKSLEQAFEYHKNEEKLLNEINGELKEYWNLQEQTRKQDEPSQLVATKQKDAAKSSDQAKSETKEKEKSSSDSKQESKKVPSDSLNTEIDDNLKVDDTNLLQLSSEANISDRMRQNKRGNNLIQQKIKEASMQRQLAEEAQQALAETEMDIKQKIQAAHEAAAQGENLLKEAQELADQLKHGTPTHENVEEEVEEDAEEEVEHDVSAVQHNSIVDPAGYRFIEIPDYAFTTEQEDDGFTDDDESFAQVDEDVTDDDDSLAQVDEEADKFDLKGVITKVMELKKKAQEMAPQVLGKIKDLREKICGFGNEDTGASGLDALGI